MELAKPVIGTIVPAPANFGHIVIEIEAGKQRAQKDHHSRSCRCSLVFAPIEQFDTVANQLANHTDQATNPEGVEAVLPER